MLYLGCHLSIAKGYYKAAQEAVSIGANTFQFFTRNPRGGSARAVDEKDIAKAAALMEEHRFVYANTFAPDKFARYVRIPFDPHAGPGEKVEWQQ